MKEIRERLKISEYQYPLSDILNPKLYKIIMDTPENQNKPSSVRAKMTGWRLSDSSFDVVIDFALKFLHRDFLVSSHENLTCSECWGIVCNKGDSIERHNHNPADYSFVYYVNAPRGSSNLVFDTSGYKIKPKEGKLVIFDSKLYHHVPKNKCDGRVLISGNFVYTGDGGVYGI